MTRWQVIAWVGLILATLACAVAQCQYQRAEALDPANHVEDSR